MYAVYVAPLAQWEHLVDRDTGEPLRAGFYRVEDRHRLAVAKPDDEVGALAEVVEYRPGRDALRGERFPYLWRLVRRQILHSPPSIRYWRVPAAILPDL